MLKMDLPMLFDFSSYKTFPLGVQFNMNIKILNIKIRIIEFNILSTDGLLVMNHKIIFHFSKLF